MAQIVLAMATPHGGLLGAQPGKWLEDGNRDRKNPELWFRGKCYQFAELAALRKGEGLERYLTMPEMEKRHAVCVKGMETLRRVWREVAPDIAIIIGKDQREVFIDVTPPLAIYVGDTMQNGPPQRPLHAPAEVVTHPGHPALALHLVNALQRDGFDMATMTKWPPNTWLQNTTIVPHAYGYVFHQVMDDKPPPTVPILMNTFYPPNQPSIGRAFDFGRALVKAIKAWDSDKRVALVTSGGLTHFVCDEATDRMFLDALAAADIDALMKVPESTYQSGTSEVKLLTPLIVAMKERGCRMTLAEYVPCYRTEAGTGEGMAFMYWRP